jgi:hypothetical protein
MASTENSCSFISDEYERQKNELKNSQTEIRRLEKTCDELKGTVKNFKKQTEQMSDKIVDLESRSMRENLIFYGIAEGTTTQPKQNGDQIEQHEPMDDQAASQVENCEELIKTFIKDVLEINPEGIRFDRAHRLGSKFVHKPRPIVVKFHNYTDRERIRVKSYDIDIKEKMKVLRQGVGVQQPLPIREARKALLPFAAEAQKERKSTRIVGNKLFVNNVLKKKFIDGNVVDHVEDTN